MLLETLTKTIFQLETLVPVGLIVVVAIFAIIVSKAREKNKDAELNKEKMPYLLKKSIVSKAEFEFSKELAKYVSRDCTILTKVSLHDIFEVDRKQIESKDYLKYFNKYSSKHVDFLVCERITFKPLYGVELDDSSHDSFKALQRDEFVNRLYSHVGLKLIRIQCKSKYTEKDFEEIIRFSEIMQQSNNTSL